MHHLAHPSAVPDGGKLLHIGPPKTGTTAVQAALHRGRTVLEEQGVFNASPIRHPYAATRFAAGHPLPHRTQIAERAWHEVAQRFRESTARATVLSSEALYRASPERARAIVEDLGGDVRVVVTLRALAPQLRAQWQESFLHDGTSTFDGWMKAVLANDERLHRTSPRTALEAWAPVVGEDRILFMVGDPGDRGSLFRRFEALLGIAAGTLETPKLDNAALSATGSEFLRQLNIVDRVKRDDPTSARAEIRRRGTWRLQHMPGLQRDSVRVPQWAAARANEAAQTWIEQLEASSATVVGRLDDLLVEVDELPDHVATPRQIDVTEAARFAHALTDAAVRHYERSMAAMPRPEDLPTRELFAILRDRVVRRISRRSR